MSISKKQPTKDLEIYDPPDSPLPAWKHYRILKAVENRLHAQLEQQEYDGRLIGLEVSYKVAKVKAPFSMGYGYDTNNKGDLIDEKDDPLSDEFVMEIYDFASGLIAEHINPNGEDFSCELSASINPVFGKVRVRCAIANNLNCNRQSCQGNCRLFINRNNTGWVCKHRRGNCRC